MSEASSYDVIVVGGGNAALCAALSAAEHGARVAVLERAPEEERGGNSAFAAGTMRAVYSGLEDVRKLVPDLSEEEIANTDFSSYSSDQFFDDMARVTRYRTHPDLCEVLVTRSSETLHWLRAQGIRYLPAYAFHSFKVEGKRKFWGGVAVVAAGGGIGLVDALYAAARKRGLEVFYEAHARQLLQSGQRITGVRASIGDRLTDLNGGAVVLACGGFEANAEWRTRYLGPGWDLAKVRGTRFNTGDGIRMALEVGAQPYGNWAGCHACEWDLNAPDFGVREIGDQFQKHCYQFSVMVNVDGRRFLDEGADLRTYTYAKYGREILAQPGQAAWQIFDSTAFPLLRDEYHIKQVTKARADTLEELVSRMEGVNAAQTLKTLQEYNAAVRRDVAFDPNRLDGKCTQGLALPKSNWANPIEKPPFEAYGVTCGITFTFGGIKINTEAEAVDMRDRPVRGLYVAGEMAGGIFYFNYPGSTGLTNGAVFGRIAGRNAAKFAKQ
ncbi:MAG: FAD-dependent tricarballylate dehydrogenase TcuA [Betaproteobacteria bacterium]|nr:FAD-dependent tricarballylate dehydrogenase TcuA [Betaproteobacteria bacterium]